MASGAFGSPIPVVHSTESEPRVQASIGIHIIRIATRVRLFAEDSISQNNGRTGKESNHVSLRSKDGMLIGEGVFDISFTTGMVLNGIKLFPNEMAVQVTRVWKPSHWIGETSCPTLSEGLGHVIRWKRSFFSSIIQGQGSLLEKNHGQYQRHMDNAPLSPELSCASTAYDYPPSTPSPVSTPPSTTQSLSTTYPRPFSGTTYLIHPEDASSSIGNLLFVDGLGVQRVVRTYRMVQRTQKPRSLWQRG
jgi:hypothetical protein